MSKKTVTMAQVLEAAQKAEELTIQVAQAAKTELETKQDALANGDGTTVVGNKVNVDTPTRGIVTEEEFNALPEAQRNKGLYVIRTEGGGSAGGGVNLLAITFGEDCLGREYTVSAGDETYTSTVPDSIQTIVAVKQPNTEYTITCGDITKKVVSGAGYGQAKQVVLFSSYLLQVSLPNINLDTDMVGVQAEQEGDPFGPRTLSADEAGLFIGLLPKPGKWKIIFKKIVETQLAQVETNVYIKDEVTIISIAPRWPTA